MHTTFSSTKNDASESTFKNDSELCVLLDCMCSLYILSSCFSIALILPVENCFVLPHGQDCCHVGPAALTASLLLKDFQYFSLNTGVLQLICTISWTKRDHNSQRDCTLLEL